MPKGRGTDDAEGPRVLKLTDTLTKAKPKRRARAGAGAGSGGGAQGRKGKGQPGKNRGGGMQGGKRRPGGGPNALGPGKRGRKNRQGPKRGAGSDTAAMPVAPILPTAPPATMRKRHWGLVFSFILLVLLPFGGMCYYLWEIAEDQFSSVAGFTVRTEESGGAQEILGGLAQLTGSGNPGADGNILYEFILSQELVRAVDARLDIAGHYSRTWETDPVFSLWPDASVEDLQWFWQRVVRISHDEGSGLIELRILAFDPEMARNISAEIVSLSQAMINDLNEQARSDALRYATTDLEQAEERLKSARAALTEFRTRTQIVDPEADIQGRMGVMNNLQQQLAEALIDFDLLSGTTREGDPRLSQAQQRISVIRERIVQERLSFATDGGENGAVNEDYPTLIAEYEGLIVDRQFAEESYSAARTALDVARAKASRQSRYLATYIVPTVSESSEFPRRWVVASLGGLFLLLSWGVLALVFYSIRDRT